ncbi:MAG: T9SS type A sorting domain-containing protein [Ignavibacteriales bacterium]|nr:T9SS type A sorting domain-containing protein [Ignavibacteriales bacterium]
MFKPIIDWNSYAYESWAWRNIPGNYNIEAVFRNPIGVMGCPSWNPVSNCWNVLGTDMYFELYGSSVVPVEVEVASPSTFSLEQNYPNPFNPSTKIKYSVTQSSNVVLKIYDVLGNEVATLVNEEKPAGSYEVEFNPSSLTSGVYFYKLQSEVILLTTKK